MQTEISDLAAFRAANPKPARDLVAAPEVVEFSKGKAFAREIGRAVEQSPRAQPLTPMTQHPDNFNFRGAPYASVPPSQVNVTLGKLQPTVQEEMLSQLNLAMTMIQWVSDKVKSSVNREHIEEALSKLREVRRNI